MRIEEKGGLRKRVMREKWRLDLRSEEEMEGNIKKVIEEEGDKVIEVIVEEEEIERKINKIIGGEVGLDEKIVVEIEGENMERKGVGDEKVEVG